MNVKGVVAMIATLNLVGAAGFSAAEAEVQAAPAAAATKPAAQPAPSGNTVVLIKTSMGTVKVELFDAKAPDTVKNFLRYVDDKHYNGTIFHRVIKDFMIQGGGFTTNFVQKPARPPIKNEAANGEKNRRGAIAMARTSAPHSATSQFFINTVDNPFLDYQNDTPAGIGYCVFGKVVDGMEVMDKIRAVETRTVGPMQNVPSEPVEILEVVRKKAAPETEKKP